MLKILKILRERRYVPTVSYGLKVCIAQCERCLKKEEILLQHAYRHNKRRSVYCQHCIKDTYHNMTGTRIWRIWNMMVGRASRPKGTDYHRYGAVGRGVSEEWKKFENFYRDMSEGYADHLTLDRIDNSKGYSKGNCRWVTNMQQQANKNNSRVLSYNGEEMHLQEFVRKTGISRCALSTRLNRGMTPEEAVADYEQSTYPKNRKSRTYMT